MKLLKIVCGILLCASPAFAASVTLNFDDIDTSLAQTPPVPNGYGGLDWSNFFAIAGEGYPATGYQRGVVSPPNSVFQGSNNSKAYPATIIAISGTFDFISVRLTDSALTWDWYHPPYFVWSYTDIEVQGSLQGNILPGDDMVIRLLWGGSQLWTFNWDGIDNLTFISLGNGGSWSWPNPGSYPPLVMDNLTVDLHEQVPDALNTLQLLVLALAALGASQFFFHRQTPVLTRN